MLAKGFPATTVDEICESAGVSKGSFYHFFESKQQVTLEMLEHHMAGAKDEIENGLDLKDATGPERAIRYVRHVEQESEEIWKDGCLIGSLALELAETNPEIRTRVSRIFRDLTDYFETLFVPLCQSHKGPDTPSPRELAEQFLIVIEGGVVLSRAHFDRRKVSQGLRCFRRYLEQLARNSR